MEEKAIINRAVLGVLLGEHGFTGVAVQSNQDVGSVFSSLCSEAENRVPVYREESAAAGYGLGCFLSDWGEASMIRAERILLKHAFADPFNVRFLFLSDSCIPLYNFSYTYDYIMSAPTSFVDSFSDTKEGRYNPKMHPVIPLHNWRKGSQPADVSKEHNCIPDEHYVQTLLAREGLEGEITRRTLTHTSWDLSSVKDPKRQGWHPVTYKLADATPTVIQSIKGIDNIYYETEYRREWCTSKGKPSPCFLFARKFTRSAALRLLNMNYGFLDSIEPANVILEKDRNVNNVEIVSAIDRTMKKHADSILHALEGVSARLSQLESRTHHLENSMDDLKISSGTNHGSTDGQLRQLENILREVQEGVQGIRDKQDRVEGQLHLLQVSKKEPQPDTPHNTTQPDNLHQAPPPPQQFHQPLPPAIIQPPSTLSLPNAPPTASQQNLAPPVQLQHQYPPNQISSVPQREPYFPPPPGQTQEAPNQQYQHPPPPQQLPPPLPAPPQPYQPPPRPPQYNQPPPQQHPSLSTVNPPQPQLSLGHHLEEPPYGPPQNYPPNLHQPPPHPPSGTQQYYGAPPNMYEAPSSRPNSGFSSSYGLGPSSGSNEPYSYSGSSSQYGGGSMKQHLSSASAQGGGNVYPQLPTAHVLPQALPTATGVGGGVGSGSGGSGNRVPIDDVVDKLSTMGFTRDQVRATVRKLTENGQSVDLNVVLDKLMNEGEGQPQRVVAVMEVVVRQWCNVVRSENTEEGGRQQEERRGQWWWLWLWRSMVVAIEVCGGGGGNGN
ncbi:hypothetical protein RHMOL_Rhmol08G0060700 [Rhododendron molle]|uniref:Uncharacterized protein n=1 Tax=Rhododendron molle TaxID=49168 RepID=A0ACC0MKM7_RHOML|nr:hypothetical protein RHMOL_Rhmol08G0060700 [Rhododendron molle]